MKYSSVREAEHDPDQTPVGSSSVSQVSRKIRAWRSLGTDALPSSKSLPTAILPGCHLNLLVLFLSSLETESNYSGDFL